MVTKSLIFDVEIEGNYVVMLEKVCGPTNIQKSNRNILKMEWSCIIGIHVQNLFDNLLALGLLLLRFDSFNVILGLNFWKKQMSHTTNLHYYIYEEKEIIFKTSLTTKEKSMNVTSKNLSTIKRNIFEGKWKKKNYIKIKYLTPKDCLVQPFAELGV